MTNSSQVEIVDDESRHSMDLDGLPQEALKAIISKLNERSQSASRTFTKNYALEINEIKQLLDKMMQEFNGRKVISSSATVSLFLSKGQRFDFRNWIEFEDFDRSLTTKTRSISMELTVDILDANSGTPERYQSQISVQNNPSEFGFVIGPLSFSSIEHAGLPPTPIAANIKFNNYIIGKNLLSSIDDWEANLTVRDKDIFHKLKPWSAKIHEALSFLGAIAGLALAYKVIDLFTEEFTTSSIVGAYAIITLVFWQVAKFSGEACERFIDRHRGAANIIFTDGDKRFDEKRLKRNKSLTAKAILTGGVVMGQLALAIFAEPLIRVIWG